MSQFGFEDEFEPTATQTSMLVESLRDPSRGVEIEQLVVDMGERVERGALERAFARSIARHASLRSSFELDGGRFVQRVHATAVMPWEGVTVADEAELDRFLAEDRTRGLDPRIAPVMRAALVHLRDSENSGPGRDVLVWTFHHAILDGRSYRRVIEEVLDELDGVSRTEPTEVPSFGDYCRWLTALPRDASKAYFAHLLDGASETPLPMSRHRGTSDRVETEHRIDDLGDILGAIERLSVSIATFVQAGWAWTLARRARVDDVLFATTRAGRLPSFAGVADLVGCAIGTLPNRVRVEAHATAEAFLRHVRARDVALRDHEHTPMAEALASARVGVGSLVVVERYDLDAAMRARGGRNVGRRFRLYERSEMPLVLAAYQDGRAMRLCLEHDRSAIEPDEARLLLAHVEESMRVLARAALDADPRPLAALPVFAPGEAERLAAASRGPRAHEEPPQGVLERFALVARERADEIAVLDAHGCELTFGRLGELSARVSTALRARGLDRGTPVLVLSSRRVHWVVAMWGVWLAEACYVPLDASWPASRLEGIAKDLVDSGAVDRTVVIVDRENEARAREVLGDAEVFVIEELCEPGAPFADAGLERGRSVGALPEGSDRVAYLLFTSGTTGRPKGSTISHRALADHADAIVRLFALGPTDRVLQFTSLAFDVSIEEVVPTLLAGARVVLRSNEASQDLEHFVAEVAREGITVLNLPSAFAHELVSHLERAGKPWPRSVRLLVVGGERPTPESYQRLRAVAGDEVRFINAYGPTEVTITSVACDAHAAGVPADGRTEIPIGHPIGRTRAYVVRVPPESKDEELERLELGGRVANRPVLAATAEPGELWLAGPQVADGYLARPGETARAFVRDPFMEPGEPGERAYRTGDLVLRDLRGRLVFLGRIDRQIKLRGHRIEPAEIEHALRAQPGVRDAAVVLAGEAHARALVAFVKADKPGLDVEAVREAVRTSLPAPMVPSAIVVLDELPLSSSGKVDRASLVRRAEAELASRATPGPSEAPADDLEAWLGPIFADVLGIDDVPLDRSFFDLGGHSLLAIRLVGRIQQERPDLPITLATLFASPSVRALAETLRTVGAREQATLVRLTARRSHGDDAIPLFCICGVALYGQLAHAMENDRPVYGAFLPLEAERFGGADGPALDVVSMAREYIALVRRRSPTGPYLLGGVSFGGLLAYEMAQQLTAAGEEVRLLALFDTILPRAFDAFSWSVRARGALRRFAETSRDAWATLRRRAAALGLLAPMPPSVEADDARRNKLLRKAAEAYDRIVRPYPGRAVVYRALQTFADDETRIRPDLGWNGLLRPDTPTIRVTGDHLGILREPGASEIAASLRAILGSD